MFTTTIFGMSAVTLVGFLAMGIGFSLARQSTGRKVPGIVLMSLGTVLVFIGLYLGQTPK